MSDTEPAAPTEPTAPTESTPSPASPTRESIRAELEATKTQYHALRNSLSEEDWKQKSGNPSWNVRQLMWHMSWANGYTMQGVESCRKGKGTNPPNWIADFGNTWITRIGSRGATRESVGEKYDESHAKVLAALEGVQEDEWQKGARVFNQDLTIEKIFRSIREHFKEHERDIKKGLGRA
ncbi:MAG: DinB family protein [Chloroflexi bacterium]|nr:MAG: DinB family protein [Chloroflexota bacterium]TMG01225.1 MAG: DinB family protein [Chloroflexota bacterium]